MLKLIAVPVLLAVAYNAIIFYSQVEFTVPYQGYVLITGASSGIGRHAAEHLVHTTGLTVLAGVRKESDAEAIRAVGNARLLPLLIDVTNYESRRTAIAEVRSMMATNSLPFVALVNNAGVSRKSPIEFHDLADAQKMFDTNFFGVLALVQLTLPLLRESKGRIVMISSVAGIVSRPIAALYSATKFALEGLSDGLRREVAHFGVSVSIVQPAFVKSSIFSSSAASSAEFISQLSKEEDVVAKSLYGKWMSATPEETAAKIAAVMASASEPTVTSEAIAHAITSKTPKTRYPVANAAGMTAETIGWVWWALPDRLEDVVAQLGN